MCVHVCVCKGVLMCVHVCVCTYLLVILDLVLSAAAVGIDGLSPQQRHTALLNLLCPQLAHHRGSWRDGKRESKGEEREREIRGGRINN